MNKTLVLFDFDGTLSKKDTFFQFLFFSKGWFKVILMFLRHAFLIFSYFFKLVSAEELKRKLFYYHFKECEKTELDEAGSSFSKYFFETNSFRKEILEKLISYQQQGADIYVVSASIGIWIHPICSNLKVNAICTELEFDDQIFKGKFGTKNCNGDEKATRIRSEINLKDYSKIIAFGNSKGDLPMLSLANEGFIV